MQQRKTQGLPLVKADDKSVDKEPEAGDRDGKEGTREG